MDGHTATVALRSMGYLGTIIGVTAHAMEHDPLIETRRDVRDCGHETPPRFDG